MVCYVFSLKHARIYVGMAYQGPEKGKTLDRESPLTPARENEQRVPFGIERERASEQPTEHRDQRGDRFVPPTPHEERPLTSAVPNIMAQQKDPVTEEIEEILSEDLGSMYKKLTPEQRVVFKREGERVAAAITVVIEKVKVGTKTILDLIRRWLRLIPGVNKFFMEQEAKIKTDKIMSLRKRIHPDA